MVDLPGTAAAHPHGRAGIRSPDATVARGVEWLLDERSLPVRLPVLLLLGAGCLLSLYDSPTVVDWALGIGAVLATAGGARWPLATSLATTGLLALGFLVGDSGPIVGKVAAAVALAELAARQGGWRPWLGAVALAGTYLLHTAGGTAATGYRAVVMAGLPLLVGGLLRGALDTARRARSEAAATSRRRAAEVAAVRAAERTAIARELHDLLAHHISSTVLRAGVARHAVPDAPPALREVLDDIHASGRETLAELRTLVTILRDPTATGESFVGPAELPAALAAAVTRTRRLGPRVTAEIGDVSALDAVTALTLLRLTQEGLTNVVRHAGPDCEARLSISTGPETRFELTDTGRAETAPASTGLGLIGLAERVELLGGAFTAGPTGTGWRMTATLPGRPA
ncbi:sensor histidine kinase [Nocardia sp. NPDC004068]|uniref:sensor histidine kinase n=1 Tax=Nocardia sp. NPDC004068 TaxID=3364303 RepID=UPI003681A96C